MIDPAQLIVSADEIDNRLGPIPSRSSDRIARELRQAADEVKNLRLRNSNLEEQRDAHAGMAWWNGLSDDERKQWAVTAGNTGRASDAWEAFKRQKAED